MTAGTPPRDRGPHTISASFTYDGGHFLLQRVPEPTVAIFAPGASSFAALLLEAHKAFERGSVKADELLQRIGSDLPAAVVGCIHAARYEIEDSSQSMLLRAAAFGKALVPTEVDNMLLANTCNTLRVLNALRAPRVGMPLTWAQFERVGADAVLRRLLARHEHLLAWRIAEHLRLPEIQAAAVRRDHDLRRISASLT
jgi:hypothetical protein